MRIRRGLKQDDILLVGRLVVDDGEIYIHVYCPACKKTHQHCWHRDPLQSVSHVSAHCLDGILFHRGYYIGIDENFKQEAKEILKNTPQAVRRGYTISEIRDWKD